MVKKKKKEPRSLTEKDLKKLEARFEKLRDREMDFYMQYLKSPWKLFTRSFLVGTAKGLGFFLGSAIIIALLSFILTRVLGDIPELGELTNNPSGYKYPSNVKETIHSSFYHKRFIRKDENI